jgi:hypothetical protein
MNDFLRSILRLADELNKTCDHVTINMIVNDMELLYEKHIQEIKLSILKEVNQILSNK